SNWTQVGSATINMASSVLVGLAVTSHNNGVLNTSTFNKVSVQSGPAPLPGPVADGTYELFNENSGKVLDDPGSSTADGTQMIQWTDNQGANQQWQLHSVGSGYYQIINVSSGKLLDDQGAGTALGTAITQNTATSGDDQLWSLVASGSYYKIVNKHSGL